jgi:hypothetical protein
MTHLKFSPKERVTGTSSAPVTPREGSVSRNVLQAFQSKLKTQFSTLTDRLHSLVGDSRGPGKRSGMTDQDCLGPESEFEVIHRADSQLEAQAVRNELLHTYMSVASWIYVDYESDGPFGVNTLVSLQQFVALPNRSATFYFKRSHLVPAFQLACAGMSTPRTGDEVTW